MKNLTPVIIFFLILVGAGGLFFWRWSDVQNQTLPNTVDVATTIFPLYDITRNIAGDILKVGLILPPGASPHTYNATPSDILTVSNASAIYAIGHGLDDWSDVIITSIGAEKVIVDNDIDMRQTEELFGKDLEENKIEFGDDDPHYYLNIYNAKQITQTIAADLSARYPEHAPVFAQNALEYLSKLSDVEQEIQTLLAPIENKSIITMHDAWYYFAGEYELFIVGSFEPTAGREPTPAYLAQLSMLAKTSRIQTLYSEPQLDNTTLVSFLRDNNLSLAILDPLGGVEGRASYIETMLYNAKTIANNQ